MAGWDDITTYLSSLFSGGPAPQQQQVQNLASAGFPGAQQMQASAPLPTLPSPAPQQQGGGITGFLANPLTQAALASYFGAIGSSRMAGLGGRLSRGGLAGLSAFGQAEAEQAKQPLQAAQTAEAQARTPYIQAQTADLTTTMKARQDALKQFDSNPAFQKMDPTQRMIVRQGIIEGKVDTAALGITPYQKAELGVRQQELASTQGHQKVEEQQGAERISTENRRTDIEARKAATEAGGKPKTENWLNPKTGQWRQGTTPMAGEIPESVAKSSKDSADAIKLGTLWSNAYAKATADYTKAHPEHLGGLYGGGNEADKIATARQFADEAVARAGGGGGGGFGSLGPLAKTLGVPEPSE